MPFLCLILNPYFRCVLAFDKSPDYEEVGKRIAETTARRLMPRVLSCWKTLWSF